MSEKTVKLIEGSLLPKGDYVSSGFSTIQPDSYFPKLYLGNKYDSFWLPKMLLQAIAINKPIKQD
ncbi:hypothetical protein [Nostoc sp. ChiVER01]|uniref:hypothetical protein n=1 Tax=Nostoc sp. ChiVER01 TaxID=3075382 RepID=UPI002AD5635D|nr:hypothetical protein [Nostoc sp. ChiVER01]MDZ8226181.1 hypothetical protein [Nostoc sp. ChiVER01]